jgi:hypothetical protein
MRKLWRQTNRQQIVTVGKKTCRQNVPVGKMICRQNGVGKMIVGKVIVGKV